MADAAYQFLSHVRTGFAASIAEPDTFGSGQAALATARVGVTVSGAPQPPHSVVLRGPGDVIGLVTSQIVRTDPVDGAVGVEPNYFAHVEFDRPDLPWLFTPAAAVGERLRPWIVLVVLDLEGEHACALLNGSPLPRLHVPAEASGQLPDPAASPVWAHAQVITADGTQVDDILARGDPRLTVSRLLCPRHLDPYTWYVAAVVPAFEVGRLAGLGLAVTPEDEARLDPAWQAGAEVVLPVYHSFRFRTGEDADFEALARRLHGRPLPDGVGTRPLDVSRPGAGIPPLPPPADVHDASSIVWLDGALRPLDSDSLPQRDAAAQDAFEASLTVLLDRPAQLVREGGADPVVAPPIYGDKHALVVELGRGTPPPWLAELNLDTRTRVAAGLGTQVVQARQEDLVARAWRQLGDVLAANRLLRAAQLARGASDRVHARLATLESESLLAIAAPARERVAGVAGAALTLARAVQESRLPAVTVEPAFRRLLRPGAPAARAAAASGLADAIVGRFAAEAFAAPVGGPDGVTAMRAATEVIGAARASAVLSALGDAQPEDATRFDRALDTLGAAARPLPAGDELRGATLRTDVGGVSVLGSLGAVPAGAVSALLAAATAPAPAPPQPPPAEAGGPFHVPHAPAGGALETARSRLLAGAHLPQGLAGAPARGPLAGALGVVFHPSGGLRVIGEGVVLRGGSVVIASDTVARIADGTVNAARIDDAGWSALRDRGTLPAPVSSADPLTDPGSRLDAFRQDPAAITALAQTANGDVGATMRLDGSATELVTGGAARTSFDAFASGAFAPALPHAAAAVTGPADLDASRELVAAASAAFDRLVSEADAPPRPPGPVLDLAAARTGLLGRLDPELTVAARVRARLDVRAIRPVAPRDDLDPVLACPVFLDPMWQAVRDLGHGWLLPGLELVPPDTATLVRTNPAFVAAHLVGLNHEFMRELLWREYPTDQRGTAFRRFWGRSGDQPDDIGPVHLFGGRDLTGTLAFPGDEAVLLLRSELLRRYPGSIVYLCRATQTGENLALDDGTIVLPVFRGDLPPDVSFVGFPVSPEVLRTPGDPWWFVIAQPPSEPRFGLDDPTPDTPAVPTEANDLAWSHMAPDGNPATPAKFAAADPPALHGHPIEGLAWGASAAIQAHLTYQHPVRVAIRAADLLPPTDGAPPA